MELVGENLSPDATPSWDKNELQDDGVATIRCGKAPLGTDPAVSATVTSIRVQANGLQPGSRALESSRRFERLLTDLVSALTRASADELHRCIRHGLGRLASQAGARLVRAHSAKLLSFETY